jgi:D-ribulokinase
VRAGGFEVAGVAVTSTSGSLVLADAEGRPVRPAILYDDGRSAAVGKSLGVNASYSLAKAAWVRQAEPEVWERARWILHPADWLTGRLSGEYGISDHSNVLKLGYDPGAGCWTHEAVPPERLPRVVWPGVPVGRVSAIAAAETGIPVGTPVFAGATDGMASLIASGASRAGDANTTLGTTLVWKALSTRQPVAAHGIYCHLHPSGMWAPGAASNTGPGILRLSDPEIAETDKDALAGAFLPCAAVGYFLSGTGERFPFVNPQAASFCEQAVAGAGARHAARLQSLAFVERWGYELMEQCGIEVGGVVYSTGGAARSVLFSSLRASVLKRSVAVARHPSAAFGAAVLAASGALFGGDICAAIRAMTSVCACYEPEAGDYDELYLRFREACAQRGYGG